MKPQILLATSLLFASSVLLAAESTRAVVIVPVADLRSDQSLPPQDNSDDQQETQLLFGEEVLVHESSGDWVSVEVPDQPSFKYHQLWEGYPGWVLKSALRLGATPEALQFVVIDKWLPVLSAPNGFLLFQLPLGARVQVKKSKSGLSEIDLLNGRTGWVETRSLKKWAAVISARKRRKEILKTAAILLGDPYEWGGRSPFDATHKTRLSGVDCSGLVHLSYQINGVQIPRDSMEQYMRSEKIKRRDLKPADLIFSAALDNPQKIIHVMLYAGEGMVLEAPKTGLTVRQISFKEKTGADLKDVESGQSLKDRVVYFGRLLKD